MILISPLGKKEALKVNETTKNKFAPRATHFVANISMDNTQKDILPWHRRLGHVGISTLKLIHQSSDSISATEENNHIAQLRPCALSRLSRKIFGRSKYIAKRLLELVHCDIEGPFIALTENYGYFVVFVDDILRYIWAFLIKIRLQEELFAVTKAFGAKAQMDAP